MTKNNPPTDEEFRRELKAIFADIDPLQLEAQRRMTPAQKIRAVSDLFDSMKALAIASEKQRHRNAPTRRITSARWPVGCAHRSGSRNFARKSSVFREDAMSQERYFRGSEFEKLLNYSRVLVDGEWVFVSGCSGFDYDTMEIADNITDQTEQTFENIRWSLDQAGVTFDDVVRIRIIVASMSDYAGAAKVIGKHCANVQPANTTWIAALPDPRIKIEIEVTARKKS